MKIRPLNDRVLVRRVAAEERSKGGIFLPGNDREKPTEGEIIAVGPGRLLEGGARLAPSVKVGDRVLFAKYSGTEITDPEGGSLIFMSEDDLLGVVANDG